MVLGAHSEDNVAHFLRNIPCFREKVRCFLGNVPCFLENVRYFLGNVRCFFCKLCGVAHQSEMDL